MPTTSSAPCGARWRRCAAGAGQTGASLVVASDLRTGLPGSADESTGGDGAAALVLGTPTDPTAVLAEIIGAASYTAEFVDRWRAPGENRSKLWEDRFGEQHYVRAAADVWPAALDDAGITVDQVTAAAVTGPHAHGTASAVKQLGLADVLVDDLAGRVGNTGAAHPFLLIASWLDHAAPGDVLALLALADGADAIILRAGAAVARRTAQVEPAVDDARPVSYGQYLAWRGLLPVEPPRRPEPARVSSSAAARSTSWKFGLVASSDESGIVHMPPRPDDVGAKSMASATGTVVTFTVDHLAYSPSPPVIFAVVDFDGGGRLPIELADAGVDDVTIGSTVEPTFRKLHSADGIHNYFWKGRIMRATMSAETEQTERSE